MKIIVTESQYRKLTEAMPLPDEEKQNRLNKSIELAKSFKRPRQFALEYPQLWNFLRGEKLIDVAFPNRQKYKPDGYWTIDTIGQESTKYGSRSEFERKNQWAYIKANELGILDALFPEIKKGRPPKNRNVNPTI